MGEGGLGGFLPPVVAELRANISDFSAKMSSAKAEMRELGAAGETTGAQMAAGLKRGTMAMGGALTGIGVLATLTAGKFEKAEATLSQAFENSGKSVEEYKGQIDAAVASGAHFGHTQDDVMSALSRLTLMVNDPVKALKAFHTVEELAAVKGISLVDASVAIGRALNGNTRILKQFGIQVEAIVPAQNAVTAATKAKTAAVEAADKADKSYQDKLALYQAATSHSLSQQQALRNSYDHMLEAHKKAAESIDTLKAKTDYLTGAQHSAVDAVGQLGDRLRGVAEGQAKTFDGRLEAMKAHIENAIQTWGAKWGPAVTGAGSAMLAFGLIANAELGTKFSRLLTGMATRFGFVSAASKATAGSITADAVTETTAEVGAADAAKVAWLASFGEIDAGAAAMAGTVAGESAAAAGAIEADAVAAGAAWSAALGPIALAVGLLGLAGVIGVKSVKNVFGSGQNAGGTYGTPANYGQSAPAGSVVYGDSMDSELPFDPSNPGYYTDQGDGKTFDYEQGTKPGGTGWVLAGQSPGGTPVYKKGGVSTMSAGTLSSISPKSGYTSNHGVITKTKAKDPYNGWKPPPFPTLGAPTSGGGGGGGASTATAGGDPILQDIQRWRDKLSSIEVDSPTTVAQAKALEKQENAIKTTAEIYAKHARALVKAAKNAKDKAKALGELHAAINLSNAAQKGVNQAQKDEKKLHEDAVQAALSLKNAGIEATIDFTDQKSIATAHLKEAQNTYDTDAKLYGKDSLQALQDLAALHQAQAALAATIDNTAAIEKNTDAITQFVDQLPTYLALRATTNAAAFVGAGPTVIVQGSLMGSTPEQIAGALTPHLVTSLGRQQRNNGLASSFGRRPGGS